MKNLTVLNTEIRTNEAGLFSLTDLWKASQTRDVKKPYRWMRLKRTQELISELKTGKNNYLSEVIKTDKKAGSFGCPEVVIAYAMFISPVFEVEVIRSYLKHAQKLLRMADQHGKAEWQQNRALGKLTREFYTDTTQKFLEYAAAQGSRNYPVHGFTMLTNMVNKSLQIDSREAATESQLHLIATAEHISALALARGMKDGFAYKKIYTDAKNKVDDFSEMVLLPEPTAPY